MFNFCAILLAVVLGANAQLGRLRTIGTCRGNGDCQNGGTCNSQSLCVCSPAWIGRFCEISACLDKPCPDGNVCVAPSLCQQKDQSLSLDYYDRDCSTTCKNGKCIGPVCHCDDGYLGVECTVPVCSAGCGVNGNCTAPDQCTCKRGWTGSNCLTRVLRPTCQGGCGEHGRCVSMNVCQCLPGYKGAKCDEPICDIDCGSHGTCTASGQCQCSDGYSGLFCSTPPNPCPKGCNFGTCIGPDTCKCNLGYSGMLCDVKYGKSLGDTCTVDAECSGTVKNSLCQSSAACLLGRCACQAGYSMLGDQCLILKRFGEVCNKADTACTENTYCNSFGICDCNPGYRKGPLDIATCTKITSMSQRGQTCQTSDDCFYDLVCIRSVCVCGRGRFAAQNSTYTCQAISYGDPCTGNRDCSHLARSECSAGFCRCTAGYTATSYSTEKGETKMTCANGIVTKAGSACLQNVESVCEANYACSTCPEDPSSPRCLPIMKPTQPILVGSASSLPISGAILVLFAAAIIGLNNY